MQLPRSGAAGEGCSRYQRVYIGDFLQRVAEALSKKYPPVDLTEFLELIVVVADMIQPAPLKEAISADPDDDKFIACALASGSRLIVSGDKHLLDVDGFSGIEVLKPKAFVDRHLLN